MTTAAVAPVLGKDGNNLIREIDGQIILDIGDLDAGGVLHSIHTRTDLHFSFPDRLSVPRLTDSKQPRGFGCKFCHARYIPGLTGIINPEDYQLLGRVSTGKNKIRLVSTATADSNRGQLARISQARGLVRVVGRNRVIGRNKGNANCPKRQEGEGRNAFHGFPFP